METVFAFTLPGGKIVTNLDEAVSGTTKVFSCPTGKRWIILYGKAQRDTSGTFTAVIRDSNDKTIGHLCDDVSAGTTDVFLPNDAHWPCRPVIDGGMDIIFTWGASQTSADVALVVLEIDIT